MIGSDESPRKQLERTRNAFDPLKAENFPPTLRGEFESWVRTWFEATSIDDFGWGTPLKAELDDSEIDMAIQKLTDQMWTKVKTDYQIHNPPISEPHYDWDE